MGKYYDAIGFATESVKIRPGIWKDQIVERKYKGDELKLSRKLITADSLSDSPVITTEISIVADAFAYDNFQKIRYICWHGVKWKVKTINVAPPRLNLEIGDVYNGDDGPEIGT